ncbi:hypothetical protein G7Y89_g6223 [Cudoniella acicularis]|uniref:ATPase synthesis protein 25 n=1 Tax=Cudoniella acicularis TaxID=354080 RepID=A0A8H4RMM9_9HELO|nr:hypothetical protein G7Y89_g6223 [Cudoniella acicularis]
MVVGRVLRATGCTSCRLSLLRSFTSFAAPTLRFPQPSSRLRPPSTLSRQARFSSTNPEASQQDGEEINAEISQKELVELDGPEPLGQGKDLAAVPWYLQVESPQRVPKTLSERQRIPDLPESPPPILQPLFQQTSIDLGLDNLTLLDLRKLDPPPALGANLLMLIGTARSERHLHVSADRLCRWLRSTYKLRPKADGLLGRNELKLKLRRKAKRAKLIGSTSDETGDDGIRTGWVCVDVGVVESPDEAEVFVERKDFVGFGRKTDGVRIVVQMFTEEKRLEMELEKLWGGILNRATQKELGEVDETADFESPALPNPVEVDIASPAKKSNNGHLSTVASTRGYHTRRRLHISHEAIHQPGSSISSDRVLQKFDLKDIYDSVITAILKGDFHRATVTMQKYSSDVPQLNGDGWRHFLLEQLLGHIQTVPKEQALEYLGAGSIDYASTSFLQCLYKTLSIFPSTSEAETRIWLHCFAQALGHPGYNPYGLLDLFSELRSYGVAIPRSSYLHLIRGVLRPAQVNGGYHGPPQRAVLGALEILQTMYDRGIEILDEEIFVELLESSSPDFDDRVPRHAIYQDPADTFDLPSLPMSPMQQRIHRLMTIIDLPCFRDESRLRLLDLYSRQQNWREFLNIWKMAPRRGKPQSPVMYAFLFAAIAQTNNQKACMNVIRTWAPEMQREDPPVPLEGQVAQSLQECIMVADPFVEENALQDPNAKDEWISWWRKCTLSDGKDGGNQQKQQNGPFLFD